MKIVIHFHTCFSHDGFITPKSLTAHCRKHEIDCVCITDHNTMAGAIEFSKQVPVRVISGEEIDTRDGEIIGLFLTKEIESGQGLEETVVEIKAQGGIVYLPHPFDEFRKSAVKLRDAEKIEDRIDIIEIFNSRTFNSKYNKMAEDFANKNGIVKAAGSDAHHPFELQNAYMIMGDFDGPESFLKSLEDATCVARKCPFLLRLYIKALKILTGKD